MLSPRWYKVLRDLWRNKTRTILVVLSIAVGVFAIGMIQSAQTIIQRDLGGAYNAVNPATAQFYMLETFDDDLVQSVRNIPGVHDAEQRRAVLVRYKFNDDQWRNIQLSVIPDYHNIRVNKVEPVSGAWPPPERQLLIESASLRMINAKTGDILTIEAPGGRLRELPVAGIAYDFNSFPPEMQQAASGYITFETLDWLGAGFAFDTLNVVTDNTSDMAEIRRIANLVRDKIERSGRTVARVLIPEPGKHPIDSLLEPLLLVMGLVGFLSLGLSGFLVVNTISAVLSQQTRQIGIMKAVGALTPQVMQLYFGMVIAFGLLSLLCAVPGGALGAQGLAGFVAGVLNFRVTSYDIPTGVLVTQIAVGLLVPLIAATIPVVAGARVTVREALSSYGLGAGRFGGGWVDALLSRMQMLSRPLILSLRNTFRRKMRLGMTLVTLVLASAIFVTVMSLRDSLILTLDEGLKYFNFDVELVMSRPYRVDLMEHQALAVPGVVRAEAWGSSSTRRLRPDGTESDTVNLIAPPANTTMVQPTLIMGRWLLPDDDNAVVVNTDFLRSDADIHVGDDIVLKIAGKDTHWRVVGIVRGILTGPFVYMNYPYYARLTNELGRAPFFLVQTESSDAETEQRIGEALEARFKAEGINVTSTLKAADLRSALLFTFNFLIVVLLMMAVLLAVVGGLGLAGTMSINVLERTREIGVMRAIGASNGAIVRIVMIEGLLIGSLSWLAGSLLALPMGSLLSDSVGQAIFRSALDYKFSTGGVALWLAIVLALSVIASFLPAWNASRLTVREVLAYE
jgi:putative ABC transport system permease protein